MDTFQDAVMAKGLENFRPMEKEQPAFLTCGGGR
jgi:hypothetical protein